MKRSLLLASLLLTVSGCTSFPSKVSHEGVAAFDEDAIADDMVRQLARAYAPSATRVHLYPTNRKGRLSHQRFEDSLRAIGYTVEPESGDDVVSIALLAQTLPDEPIGTWCLQADQSLLCREYRTDSATPAGPVSTNLTLATPEPIEQTPSVVASDLVWFASESGRLGPQGREKVDALIAEFLASGAEAVRIIGISAGRSAIGNDVIAERRAQAVADAFFDAGVAPGDIQMQTLASAEEQATLPTRAAIVSFLASRGRP